MAFWDKYKLEIADTHGIVWTVLIQEDSATGTTTVLKGSGNPITFEFYGDDNPYDQPIMGSKAVIEVMASTSFAYSDLFTSENLTYKVIIKWGTTVYWNGWILANNYQEPYDCVPFPVQIVATDGLGLLSDFNFEDLAYTTRQKVSVVIHDILALVGIDTFTEFVNLYESAMDQAVGDSPFDQCGIHWESFEAENCYTALTEILKAFNAGIRQDQGAFIIYRFEELKDASMKGRTFTDGTTKSATTRTPLQYVNRDAQASNFWDHNGGTISIAPQLKKLYVNQDYGFRGSMFTNHDFRYEEFVNNISIDGWTPDDVSTTLAPVSLPIGSTIYMGSSEKQGMIILQRDYTTVSDYFYQTVEGRACAERLVIEFECCPLAPDGTEDIGNIYASLISTNGVYTEYFDSVTMDWSASESYILIGGATSGSITCDATLKWQKYTITVDELPWTGDLTVRLWAGFDPDGTPGKILSAWRSVNIYFTDIDIPVQEGIGYTVSNNISGQTIEREILIGDGPGLYNEHLQYRGVLNVWDGSDIVPTTKTWETVTAGTGNGENDPLIELISNEIGSQFVRPKQLLDLPLRERHDDEFFKMVGNLQDTSNKTGGNNRVFMPCHGTFDVKNRAWYLTLTELL